MGQSQGTSGAHRIARLTSKADDDRVLIYLNTAQQWGTQQADSYDAFLETEMQRFADQPVLAPFVPNLDNVRSFIARWKNARYGHRVFFEETDDGILILRILHSSMIWPDYFD